MKVVYLLFLHRLLCASTTCAMQKGVILAHSEKIIKNINIHPCRNCIFFKPYDNDFTSSLSRCEKFGDKNIVSGEITYEYADVCRKNEDKCGTDGKYFEEDKQIEEKIFKNNVMRQIPVMSLIFFYFSWIGSLMNVPK
jgi:hypothetical protein